MHRSIPNPLMRMLYNHHQTRARIAATLPRTNRKQKQMRASHAPEEIPTQNTCTPSLQAVFVISRNITLSLSLSTCPVYRSCIYCCKFTIESCSPGTTTTTNITKPSRQTKTTTNNPPSTVRRLRSVSVVENVSPFNHHHHHQQNYCYYFYYYYYFMYTLPPTVLCYTASTATITRTWASQYPV